MALHKLGKGIADDVRARAPYYVDDWREGINSGFRIFAPSTCIFFASAIPALAFGEQIDLATKGAMNGVNVLAAAAICGLLQAVFGGQPLMIIGIAQPVVIVYIFMYDFLDDQDKVDLYLPWAAWTCIWAGIFIALMAVTNVCAFIDKFTRFSGEIFGMLIGVLFIQQSIIGLVEEFETEQNVDETQTDPNDPFDASRYHWRLVNGLWSLILAFGLLLSSLVIHEARSWRFGKGWVRTMLADYGVPIMITLWTGVSYALKHAPSNIPRRLNIPNTWDDDTHWKSAQELAEVDGWLIAASVVPGIIIAVLYYFDHNISAKLAQQDEYHLKKPPAYHYDFLLLAFMTVLCGVLGLPPANGCIPQSPMHTKSLASLKKQLIKRDIKRESMRLEASRSRSIELPNINHMPNIHHTLAEIQNAESSEESSLHQARSARELLAVEKEKNNGPNLTMRSSTSHSASDAITAVEVKEQRLSNFIQSVLVALCLGITPVLQEIPKSVLWGYYAYMAIVNLPGSEFWDRILLLLTDKKRRFRLLESPHPAYLETVPTWTITKFTLLQIVLLLIVWGITFAGLFGIVFPVVIMLIVPARQYLMPKVFNPEYLRELDTAEYEEVDAIEPDEAIKVAGISDVSEDEIMRERLDQEIVGTTVKHHVTREEIKRRRRSVGEAVDHKRDEGHNQHGDQELLPR